MIRIEEKDFDVSAEIEALVSGEEAGAVVTFIGRVRGREGKRRLVAMELEHYPGMTEKQLAELKTEAHQRWPLLATLIVHRVGRLEPGDNIVLVIAVSAHRTAAFEAASYLMDFLKIRATFWKREFFSDGSSQWVDIKGEDIQKAENWGKL